MATPFPSRGLLPFDNPVSQWADPRRNALMGFSAGMLAGNPGAAMTGAMQGSGLDQRYAQMQFDHQNEQDQQNATAEWLKAHYPQYSALPPAQGYQAAMADMSRAASGAGQESFFGTGIPIQNADGTISYGQFGNQGSFNVPELPAGAQFLTPVQQLNAGTGFVGVDRFGNQTGGITPIDNFGAAQDTALGKVIGEAAAGKILELPQTLATSNNMIASIDGILNDPALDVSTGWLSWMQGVPGTEQYRFGQRALQLQGQAFLQAFESLKGGGQITEIEGQKAEQAIGRLSTAQNPADYRAALNELKSVIEAAKQRAISGASNIQLPGNAAIQPGAPSASGNVLVFNPETGRLE
ncbi:hypothetical protein ACFOOL_14920 [Devosia honganensis]|uniref:Tail fiber domain-containing protein n=1 Tax=Devosia honganensis TaxID=1610527 RepID=A0ABV7X3S6_9HYPH